MDIISVFLVAALCFFSIIGFYFFAKEINEFPSIVMVVTDGKKVEYRVKVDRSNRLIMLNKKTDFNPADQKYQI